MKWKKVWHIALKQAEEVGCFKILLKRLVPVGRITFNVGKKIYWNDVSLMSFLEGISFKRSAAVKDYSALNKKMKLKGGIGEIIGAVVQSCNLTSIYLKTCGP